MFCKECGCNIGEHSRCPYCRTNQETASAPDFIDLARERDFSKRSRTKAGFMQIFLGGFGAGRFYLGCKRLAVFQIAATLATFGLGGFVWGFVDGIMILSGKEKYDGYGKILQ